jgi:polyhydroxybutyrate depolymerase
MRHSSLSAGLGVAALVLLAAACGDSDTGGDAPADTDGGTASETGTTGVPIEGGTTPEPTAGCGATGVKTGFVGSQSLTVGGSKRTYELFVPPSYDGKKTFPLTFVFHGDGGTGAEIRGSFKLEAASESGSILVYPDALNKTWVINNATGFKADVAFVDAIAADLAKSHCTDSTRVFAVGFSKGAYFTNELACLAKTKLRAIVSHSGGGPFGLDGSGTKFDNEGNLVCPAAPVAALQIQGTADTSVPVSEATKARDYWRRLNGCQTATKPYDPSPCVTYDGCNADRPEVWCEVPGLGHAVWQNAPAVTWAFLKTK